MALNYDIRKTPGDTAWFRHDRFGMFIHWGLYSMPSRHEWVKNHEEKTNEEYEKYFKYFDPDLYDPKEWAKAAKNANGSAGSRSDARRSPSSRRRPPCRRSRIPPNRAP